LSDVTVVVIDDHPIYLDGLLADLAKEPGITCLGNALTMSHGLRVIQQARPDVVVCDLMFDGEPAGLSLPAQLKVMGLGDIRVLFLSHFDTPMLQAAAQERGGVGLVCKSAGREELGRAIVAVARGESIAGQPDTGRVPTGPRQPSERELQIIRMVAEGLAGKEIAYRVGISESTVEKHLERMSSRYSVHSRAQLVSLAYEMAWLNPLAAWP
jgi:DNA-binding NarL/FixJ family response regulator